MTQSTRHARRDFLGFVAAAAAGSIAAPALALAGPVFSPQRFLAFHHLDTGESLAIAYFDQGRYLPDAARRIAYELRDFRTGEVHAIDPKLLDLLARLRQTLGVVEPFTVICGYRSPQTNALRREETSGIAANSLHMEGKAIDLRVAGIGLSKLRDAAIALKAGGVGYYPRSNFVHVDVGPVRHW
jgi:uncharacterized protein YcbK (DUF882 family)